ncbi:MAG: beta-ketoacyl-ACP synthase III [Alphaproteobacteria bacterium]
MTINSYISSVGHYLPSKIVTNFDLEQILDTTDEWIVQRTGIKQRHLVADGEYSSDMAYNAAKTALENSQLTKEDIDLIIVATTTPDNTFPSTATKVQAKLGITKGAAFDIQAVCTGFIYALTVADNFIKTGQANNVIVIGVDSMSKIVDWNDRSTCILFGDGAGALILSKTNEATGIIASKIESDGNYGNLLYTDGGVCLNKTAGIVKMNGRELLRHAVDKMATTTLNLLTQHNLTIDNVNYLVPHQANIRILSGVAKKMDFPEDKVIITIDKHANTSAASIPLAIAAEHSKFKKNDLIALTAFGGGLTWGSSLLKWNI